MNQYRECVLLGFMLALLGSAWADMQVVVGAASPVGPLSKQQAADIFMGRVSSFPDGSQAIPIDLEEGAKGRAEFYEKLTGKSEAQLRAYRARMAFTGVGQPPRTVPGVADMKKLVSANPNLIGYVEAPSVDATLKVVLKP